MTMSVAPPGWHPDPSNPTGAFRWWDGTAWTTHTQQAPAAAPAPVYGSAATYGSEYAVSVPAASPYGSAPAASPYAPLAAPVASPYAASGAVPTQAYGNPYGSAPATPPGGTYYPAGFGRPANVSFAKQNTHSLTAMGVAAAYILIAMSAHIVFIGIIPIMLSVRAFNSRERLAPFALIAAIIAVVLAFAALR
jgi:hypothetical protein